MTLFFSCAKQPSKKLPAPPPGQELPTDLQTPTSLPPPLHPKREASQRIVQDGLRSMEQGEFEKASQTFQEAINVDSRNGVAYFYMSQALFKMHQTEDARGLLDRAESLLRDQPHWLEKITEFRTSMEEPAPEGEIY
ncbi:MAG: tetratricopeptide repeat protein [Deltaproteobacteria bacterium]|nr:tetratricopeptide repeat protein [Deltaproteobacteria bacterium]